METNIIKKNETVTALQYLSENKFSALLESVPTIDIDLDWDNGLGVYECEDQTVDAGDYMLVFGLCVQEYQTKVSATHFSPEEYNTESKDVEVYSMAVWFDDEVIDLSIEQYVELKKVIANKINC